MQPTAPEAMQAAVAASPLMAQYGTAQERESAAEKLAAQASAAEQAAQAPATGDSARDGGTALDGQGAALAEVDLHVHHDQRPPRAEKPMDPDSPFAVLAALKNRT